MNKLIILFWFSMVPLLIGLVIYLTIGSTETIIYKLLEDLLGNTFLTHIRFKVQLPSFIRFHLADGLWAFAMTSTLCLLFLNKIHRRSLLIISIFAAGAFELAQYFGITKGTFDLIDLATMLVFSLLAYFTIIYILTQISCDKHYYSLQP